MDSLGPDLPRASTTAILEAVADAAQRLAMAPTWQEAMPDVLAKLGTASLASRAHVFRNHQAADGRLLASQLFEWCAPDIESYADAPHLQDFDWVAAGYARWIELMERGEAVHGTANSFPPEERFELEREGIVSTISFPLFVGSEWWGTVGFDDCVRERTWSRGEVEALRSAAAIIGASILRQRAEEENRALVENGPLMTYQERGLREDVDLLYLSPQVEDVLGYPPGRWQDPTFWPSIVHPDDRDEVLAEDADTVREGRPFDMDYRVIAADGRTVWLNDRAVPVYGEDGAIAYLQGFMLDITDRKEAEMRLAEAEERYRFLVERGPLATYLLGFPQFPIFRPIYLSPQFEAIFGYPMARWEEDGFWDSLVHPDDVERVHQEDQRSIREGAFDLEYRMTAADGRIVWIHDVAEVVVGDDGARVWNGYVADVTQQREAIEERERAIEQELVARQQVEQLSGLKDVLLQAVSHDVRTPLTAILGMSTTLAQPDLELTDAERREFAARISVNTTRLDRLVSDLLDLDRLSRGELHANLLNVDLAAIAREVAGYTDTQGRDLTVETAPAIVQADPAKVERIIDNLLGNAVKHTPRGAHLWLVVEPTEGGGVIRVEDDGEGVPDEEREGIFDLYRKGGHTGGSGVGLSLVRRFAELHGGRAWVATRGGGGASFRVWLPATPDS